MSRIVAMVARVGDLGDAVAESGRALPGHALSAIAVRRYRRVGLTTAVSVLTLYLVAIGDITVALDGRFGRLAGTPSAEVTAEWTDKLVATRAPYLFEAVLVFYPLPHLAVLVSPGNLVLAGVLAALVGLNVAVSAYAVYQMRSCRRTSFGGLLGAVPAFLTGFVCCVPTVLLVLGTGVAAALLPVFLPVRSYLYPLALALLAAALLWNSQRISQARHS